MNIRIYSRESQEEKAVQYGDQNTNHQKMPQHIFIIGAKGLGNYGGFETFVDKLTEMHKNNRSLKYHVACKANGSGAMDERKLPHYLVEELGNERFEYHNADCFKISVPEYLKSAQALYYDATALKRAIRYCKKNSIPHPVFYILACRIGPWIGFFASEIHKLQGKLYVNPDGHEWMRTKWSPIVRLYWKISEKMMVRHADLLICDSKTIESYIQKEYARFRPSTVYIAYGADINASRLGDDSPAFQKWLQKNHLKPGNYYLIVGRFVPENNFETIIREYMKSHSKKDLAIITTPDTNFFHELNQRLHFENDPRIKFTGTVYNPELLKKIRENACGYIHGHSVGGTNPSLLEALGSTRLNLLYDVGFNREVGQDASIYWTKKPGELASIIDRADQIDSQTEAEYGKKAKNRIKSVYSWEFIAAKYEKLFTGAVK